MTVVSIIEQVFYLSHLWTEKATIGLSWLIHHRSVKILWFPCRSCPLLSKDRIIVARCKIIDNLFDLPHIHANNICQHISIHEEDGVRNSGDLEVLRELLTLINVN